MSLLRPILQYPEDKLTQALDAIRNGMAIREASRNYRVPRGTIQDRLHLRVPEGPRKMGPDSILNKLEEAEIATWLKDIASCGFGKKPDNLFNTVQDMMIEDGWPNPFVNGRPGKKWMNSFLKHNNMFSMRTPEAISKGRAVITEESIRKWFKKLTDYLTKNQALDVLEDPKRILNGDETSFMLCPKTGKVIAPRGYKNVYQIVKGKKKEALTVLAFFSAMGDILPPCVVFPYIRPPKDVINSMPDGWFLGKSDTGWMKADIFYDYISKCLSKWIDENKVKKPGLVFIDGHKTHMTMKLSKYCHDNNIILHALPLNTTQYNFAKGDFDMALKVIKHLENDLTARGVDMNVVLKIIENTQLIEESNNFISSNTTERGVEDNEKGVIVSEITELGLTVTKASPIIKKTEKNGAKDELYIIKTEEKNKCQKETEIESDRTKIDNKEDDKNGINTSQSELALGDLTFLNNNLLDDDIHVSTFEINDNLILVPCHQKPKTNSVIQIRSPNVSPFVRKHLIIPSPIKKTTTPRVMNRIGAISSEEWRQFEISKEEEKQKKKDAVEERKLQRQKNKEEKQKHKNAIKKNKIENSTKRKVKGLTTKKKNDDSDPEWIVKSSKKRNLSHMNDIAEEAEQTNYDLVEAKSNKIKILSDILITPGTSAGATHKDNIIPKKNFNRRTTFRNEEELEIF